MANEHLQEDISRINSEGFEDNAAVVIRKSGESEADPTKEKLEHSLMSEGKAENLATYIRMNKKIVVPAEDVLDSKGPGRQYSFMRGESIVELVGGGKGALWFLDKSLNVAMVDLDLKKVAAYSDLQNANLSNLSILYSRINSDLEALGFTEMRERTKQLLIELQTIYQNRISLMAKAEASKEWDF